MTVNGSGFVSNSVVRWNGSNRTTAYVSPNQLTAQILATDVQAIQTATVAVFTPAPGGGNSNTINFNVVACNSITAPANLTVPVGGGNYMQGVSNTNGCSWTASTTATWITNLTSGGVGDGGVSFSVQPNTGAARAASIQVAIAGGGSATFSVGQSGCDFSVPINEVNFSAAGGSAGYVVTTSASCTWSTTTNAPYVTITTGSTGVGSGPAGFLVAPNTGPARQTTVISAGRTIAVNQAAATSHSPFDFDGDGKTDLGIFRPSTGDWWINRSGNGSTFAAHFGDSNNRIVPGDYTGDGKSDIAYWRPATGEWYVLRSEDNSFFSVPFGNSSDIPTPADYDADLKTDVAVFRPSTGTWYISRSSGGTTIQQFGTNGDRPVAADYDGDGRADLAIYRPSVGEWWINRSTAGGIAMTFGVATDKPVQGDYTGDGKADVAFWRPSTGEWFVLRSEDASYYSVPFGASTDLPTPGDYDGDGKIDTAVFRPSSATWYVQRTTAGTLIQNFGATGDRPIPNSFVP
jgi:hypothetical protein